MSTRSNKEKNGAYDKEETTSRYKTSDKQTGIDSIVTHLNKESNIAELIVYINSLDQKVASNEYIDKGLQT